MLRMCGWKSSDSSFKTLSKCTRTHQCRVTQDRVSADGFSQILKSANMECIGRIKCAESVKQPGIKNSSTKSETVVLSRRKDGLHRAKEVPRDRVHEWGKNRGGWETDQGSICRRPASLFTSQSMLPTLPHNHELWVKIWNTRETSFLRRVDVLRQQTGAQSRATPHLMWLGRLVRIRPGRVPGEVRPRTHWRESACWLSW